MSKQTRNQCRNPIAKGGTTVCRFHGHGGGPKTEEGRQRCAEAKTVHGNETRQKRAEHSNKVKELFELEMLGRELGLIVGPKSSGRKPRR